MWSGLHISTGIVLAYRSAKKLRVEWVAFRAGACELALHGVGREYRVKDTASWRVETNAKMVLTVTRCGNACRVDCERRADGWIKSYPGFPGPLCDGKTPRGMCSSWNNRRWPNQSETLLTRDGSKRSLLAICNLMSAIRARESAEKRSREIRIQNVVGRDNSCLNGAVIWAVLEHDRIFDQ
jgi:hypothetical protein